MKTDDLCRCCLSENIEMLNIHTSVECQDTEEVIYNMLTWSFNVEILPDDDLPHQICLQCIDTLKSAYCFKKTIEESKKIFQLHIENARKNNSDLSDDEPLAQMLKNSNSNNSCIELCDEDIVDKDTLERCYEESYPKEEKKGIKSHEDLLSKKYYYCSICLAKFKNLTKMYVHCVKTHESDEFGRPCDFCNQRFPDFKTLIEHRKKHFHPYVCPICWGGFYDETEFTIHVVNCKPKVDESTSVNGNVRKMTMCHVCGKSYPSTYLSVHMKIHNEGSLSCSYCGKKFKQPSALGSHIVWTHKKDKKHKCPYCTRLFVTASAKGTHIRESHEKEKNVECETCGKRFFSKSRMKKHNLTHTGEKNFACNLCEKSYQTRYGLNVHLKSHNLIESSCI